MADLSTDIQIVNNTLFEFNHISEEILFGEWKIQPPGLVAPETSSTNFLLNDVAGSPSGSEGKLSYAFGETIIDMTFCDSYAAMGNYATINTRGDTVLSNRYEITISFKVKINDGTWVDGSCPKGGHPVSVIYTIDAKYPRPATDAEYQRQIISTPGINRQIFRYLSDENMSYNSGSWSMGIDYVWINLPLTIQKVIQMYTQAGEIVHTTTSSIKWRSNFNYVLTKTLANDADVDLMCRTQEGQLDPMHAIRTYQDAYYNERPVWTSKFGIGIHRLAKHERKTLQGKFYGEITHSFVKHYVSVPSLTQGENNSVIYKDFNEVYRARHLAIMDAPVDIGQMEKLDEIIQGCDAALKTCFEERYACWKRECANMCSSNTYTYVLLNSFSNLAAMGTGILPLVVKKMSLEQNFHDLPLYESLQPEKLLCVSQPSTNAEDSLPLEAEQSRARRTVHLYLQDLP